MVKKTENELNFSHNLNFVQFYHLFLPLKVRFLFFFCFTSSRRGMKLFCVNTYNLRLTLSCGWVKHANTQKGFAYFLLWQFITHSLFCCVLSCLNTQHAGGEACKLQENTPCRHHMQVIQTKYSSPALLSSWTAHAKNKSVLPPLLSQKHTPQNTLCSRLISRKRQKA